jgi:hypothetical protein
MDVNQFLAELNTSLSVLDFVESVSIEQRSITYIKIKVVLKPNATLKK